MPYVCPHATRFVTRPLSLVSGKVPQDGPRELLGPLVAGAPFQPLAERYGMEFVHGPLLGAVTDRRARFWVRTWNEIPVQVYVRAAGETTTSQS